MQRKINYIENLGNRANDFARCDRSGCTAVICLLPAIVSTCLLLATQAQGTQIPYGAMLSLAIAQVPDEFGQNHSLASASGLGRVWRIDDPLYAELFSDEPAGLAREGALYWFHGMFVGPFAQRFGMQYGYEELFRVNAANKLLPFANTGMLDSPEKAMPAMAMKTALRFVLLPGKPSFIEPNETNARLDFMSQLRGGLKRHADVLWGVASGDEAEEDNIAETIERLHDPAKVTPALLEADKQVREKYGFGRYGIPDSKTERAPLKWIAFYRYMNDMAIETLKTIRREVKTEHPQLKLIGYDPRAFGYPYDFSRWASQCDILTQQMYPHLSPHRAEIGYLTKLVKDISGAAEFWPCPHIENYPANFSPDECVELLSQVFRNGGTGLHLYLGDTIGKRGSDKKPYLISEYFGAPDRWQLEMAIVKEAGRMKKLKFPKPDFAILYSCDSFSSLPNLSMTNEAECCYTFVGPVARSWFAFIDDNQIERGKDLSAFKAIYVPLAKYQRRSVVEALEKYVRDGGVVVCGDPEAFSFDRDGSSLAALRENLCGVALGERTKQKSIVADGKTLPVFDNAYTVTALPQTEILGRFANGKPALLSHAIGKGRTIYFAANPFTLKGIADASWRAFFKTLQTQLGLKTGHDIWRFQFPKSLIQPPPPPEGKCLTNNHILWRRCQPDVSYNLDTEGTYRYSLVPNWVGDVGAGDISFSQGKLTDRRQVLDRKTADGKLACNQPQTQNDWIVAWNKPDPYEIVFDFKKLRPIDRVTFYFSGQLPDMTVAGSVDGHNWTPLGDKSPARDASTDVQAQTIAGPFVSCRYLKVSFGARPAGKSLTLAEVEVWSAAKCE
jgi:hypothetical protein